MYDTPRYFAHNYTFHFSGKHLKTLILKVYECFVEHEKLLKIVELQMENFKICLHEFDVLTEISYREVQQIHK